MRNKLQDTIAAIATALGESALAIVRVSGDDTPYIFERIFRYGKKKSKIRFEDAEPFRMYYGFIIDPESEKTIDEVMVCVFKAPKSYTTENMIEIYCHGGTTVPQLVLNSAIKAGARLAEPGEFTLRAFIGGRIDLTQAEAIYDIIHSKSPKAHEAALDILEGRLKDEIIRIKELLKETLMLVEASIDFPEEDDIETISFEEIKSNIKKAKQKIEELLSSYSEGKLLREGVKVAIVGKPNVGKSSMLNTLLKEQRAIVTNIPGTTRDTIEESILIKGITFNIADTAGIRKTNDPVEKEGVSRTLRKIEEADLVIFIIDGTQPIDEEDIRIFKEINSKPCIIAINKIDKHTVVTEQDVKEVLKAKNPNIIKTSAKYGTGIEDLKSKLFELYCSQYDTEHNIFINERHKEVLQRTLSAINRCIETINAGLENEFISIDLKEAINALGEITGEVTTDDILNMIFDRFCIGK